MCTFMGEPLGTELGFEGRAVRRLSDQVIIGVVTVDEWLCETKLFEDGHDGVAVFVINSLFHGLAFFQNEWIRHARLEPSFNPRYDILVWPGLRMEIDAHIRRVKPCDKLGRGDKAQDEPDLVKDGRDNGAHHWGIASDMSLCAPSKISHWHRKETRPRDTDFKFDLC